MEIDAKAPEGNVFNIINRVKELLYAADRKDEWPAIRERMTSGDYDNACNVAEEVTYGSIVVVNRTPEEAE